MQGNTIPSSKTGSDVVCASRLRQVSVLGRKKRYVPQENSGETPDRSTGTTTARQSGGSPVTRSDIESPHSPTGM